MSVNTRCGSISSIQDPANGSRRKRQIRGLGEGRGGGGGGDAKVLIDCFLFEVK